MRIADSPAFLESVANHPRNFRWLAQPGMQQIEVPVEVFARMVVLEFSDGVFSLLDYGGGTVSVHGMFLPKASATEAKARQVFAHAFINGATRLITQIMGDCWHAKRYAKRLGFRRFKVEENAWPRESGAVDVEWYELFKDEQWDS